MQGVRINLVRAMSRGARTAPAMPTAETATTSEERGDGEDRMSSPPELNNNGVAPNDSPGSGRARKAEKNDRTKEVMVERSIE